MLQATNEEAWLDVIVSCTIQHGLSTDPLTPREMPHGSSRDQPVSRPVVRLFLRFCLVLWRAVALVNENAALAMQDDMGRLMEEGEPKVVIGLVAVGLLNQSLARAEPPGRATDGSLAKRWHKYEGNTGAIAELADTRHQVCRFTSREPFDFEQRV